MKKIDFHLHTIATDSDVYFEFSLQSLSHYVERSKLDAIAITNHDMFDLEQFREISDSLDIVVFPGIEINLEKGHLLLIGEEAEISDFKRKADLVSLKVRNRHDFISVDELEEIYENLDQYLLIPHYEKKPPLPANIIERLSSHINAGEVTSAKKFITCARDETRLTPVLFSDSRLREGMNTFSPRQTFINCGQLTLTAIKRCLAQRKVALSKEDGNRLFQAFENGQMLSTGLNVVLGDRSSGKTITLNKLDKRFKHCKYIRQFELVQQDETACKEAFESDLRTKGSEYSERYLSGFKQVVDDIKDIDLRGNFASVQSYVDSLIKSAEHADRQDACSSSALFNETKYRYSNEKNIERLINSVINVIENVDYKETIAKHIYLASMKALALDLIEQHLTLLANNKKKKLVNLIVEEAKTKLRRRTTAAAIEDVDLYTVTMDKLRVERFNEIVTYLKAERVINQERIQGFTVIAKKQAFTNATEAKKAIRQQCSLAEAFSKYDSPYEYLQALIEIGELPNTDLYKLFTGIQYEILNSEGEPVSGGERSEFRLLQEIKDAHNYNMLLIDEPESSFDNGFLNSDVNQIIRDIASTMPVVVVTHNSTVGASIEPDYLIYADKAVEEGDTKYRLYSGRPTDTELNSVEGHSKQTHTILMNSLEAGEECYDERRLGYEAVKHRQ